MWVGSGGGYNKKTIAFCLADFGNELKKYSEDIVDTFFATVMLSYDTNTKYIYCSGYYLVNL